MIPFRWWTSNAPCVLARVIDFWREREREREKIKIIIVHNNIVNNMICAGFYGPKKWQI